MTAVLTWSCLQSDSSYFLVQDFVQKSKELIFPLGEATRASCNTK